MRLNLGSGDNRLAGWVNVDLERSDQNVDLSRWPWPWADGEVQDILASHVLEHFSRDDGRRFLAECARVLRPGGRVWLAVPDLDRFIDCHLTGDLTPLNGYAWTDLNYCAGGYGEREPNPAQRHRYIYSWASLAWTLQEVGLRPERRTFTAMDTEAYQPISLYAAGVKPA